MTLARWMPEPGRTVLVCWLWLALLWLSGSRLPRIAPWLWLLLVLVLAALPAWGLWLRYMLRKRVLSLQFASQGWVRQWLSGGLWPAVKAGILALTLVVPALWQAYFLAPWEWALLAAAPLAYGALLVVLRPRLAAQFNHPAFAWTCLQRLAIGLTALLLGGTWLLLMLHGSDASRALTPAIAPEQLDQAIATVQAARSGLVRWGLDFLLALQVAGDALLELPKSSTLRTMLLLIAGPGLMSACLGCVLQGASGLHADLRRAARLRESKPGPLPTAVPAFLAVLLLSILLSTTASLDPLAGQHRSPLALERLQPCERIDGQFYTIGTSQRVQDIALGVLGRTGASQALCQGSKNVGQQLEAAIEEYLDWYFSLPAEWGRIFHLLTGGAEEFLEKRLQKMVMQAPGLEPWLKDLHEHTEHAGTLIDDARQRIDDVLARHHLAVADNRCLVQIRLDHWPAMDLLGHAHIRIQVSAAAGVGASAFASALAAKAMGKTGMKAATKVLAKAAAKQGMGKAGAAATGAALGSVVPGVGTVAGALAGTALGMAVGAGIDWMALRAEEKLTREDMRADLHATMSEHLADLADALGCSQP